jgi:hypothetical protein
VKLLFVLGLIASAVSWPLGFALLLIPCVVWVSRRLGGRAADR